MCVCVCALYVFFDEMCAFNPLAQVVIALRSVELMEMLAIVFNLRTTGPCQHTHLFLFLDSFPVDVTAGRL